MMWTGWSRFIRDDFTLFTSLIWPPVIPLWFPHVYRRSWTDCRAGGWPRGPAWHTASDNSTVERCLSPVSRLASIFHAAASHRGIHRRRSFIVAHRPTCVSPSPPYDTLYWRNLPRQALQYPANGASALTVAYFHHPLLKQRIIECLGGEGCDRCCSGLDQWSR